MKATPKRPQFLAFLIIGVLSFICIAASQDTISIKILAVNPSGSKNLKTTISQYLPSEINPDDIVDIAGMTFTYDTEKQAYKASIEVDLKPQETQTFEIKVKNVWIASPDEIEDLRKQLNQGLANLKGTDYEGTAKLLHQSTA